MQKQWASFTHVCIVIIEGNLFCFSPPVQRQNEIPLHIAHIGKAPQAHARAKSCQRVQFCLRTTAKFYHLFIENKSIPDAVEEPLVQMVMNAPDGKIMNISDVFEYNWQEPPHTFDGFIDEECVEMTVIEYGRR